MNRIAVWGIASIALGALPAAAADLPVKARPMVPVAAAYNWSGCYIGGTVGAINGRNSYDNGPTGAYLGGAPGIAALTPVTSAAVSASYGSTKLSITGGGEIGCNYQTGSFVFGLEGDINGSGLRNSTTPVFPATAGGFLGRTETETQSMSWYSTVRGRAGFTVWDRGLVYVTGGLAIANFNSSFNVNFTNTDSFAGSASTTRAGWVIGGGYEWALTNNWSVKAEYLHMDFGRFSMASPNTMFVTNGAADPRYTWTTNIRAREDIVRVGVNYKLDWGGPVVARF